jgi:hypothetical protein
MHDLPIVATLPTAASGRINSSLTVHQLKPCKYAATLPKYTKSSVANT